MSTTNKFTAAWERFFLIAGNMVFLFAFCILLKTNDQELCEISNLKLFAINLFILGILYICYRLFPTSQKRTWRHPLLLLAGGYFLLFLLQCIYVRLTYFYTGWDVGLMQSRVEAVLSGQTMQDISADIGYSIYPNNLFLFYIQYLLAKIGELFALKQPYNLCIYVSCFCVNVSCFLGSLVIRKVSQSGFIRLLYTLISTVYILFSPWIVIPYSDTYGMLFVALGIWAVCCLEKPFLKWPVLAFAGLIGYRVKPTCIFLLFAAGILYAPRFLTEFKTMKKELCILLLSCVAFFGAGQGIFLWAQHSLSFRIDPELKYPPLHYIMMGLNETSKGGFDESDYFFTAGIPTYEGKKQTIKKEIRNRWDQMTTERKVEHFTAKFLYTFNDGTFSWAREGGFFLQPQEHDNPINDLYLEIFHPEGKFYIWYCRASQTLWLLILCGILFAFTDLNRQTSCKSFLFIVLCGLMAFLLLFEARARYLLLYAPAFLLLSLLGYEALFSNIKNTAASFRQRKSKA